MPNANFADFRCIVVMLKDGGEDSILRLRSRNVTHLAQIRAHRPTLGFSDLAITSNTGGNVGPDWNLHPNLNPLQAIFNAGHLAFTHGLGPMVTDLGPLTTAQVREATYRQNVTSIEFPQGLGAHDWQQNVVASMVSRDFEQSGVNWTIAGSGFLGRIASQFASFTANSGSSGTRPPTLPLAFATGQSSAMRNLINHYQLTRPLDIPSVGGRFRAAYQVSAQQTSALAALANVSAMSVGEPRQDAWRAVHQQTINAIGVIQPVVETAYDGTLPADYEVDRFFANTNEGWEGVLRTFARMLEDRAVGAVGLPNRLILVGSLGSYDTHHAQGRDTGALPNFFTSEAAAMASFYNALINMPGGSILNNVVLTDWSEFSRTLLENGAAGTDHAWARIATIMGGPVRGNGVGGSTGHFGQAPTSYGIAPYNPSVFTGGGSDDINGDVLGGGTQRPWVSSEEYWGEILEWFGANTADLDLALPRRAVFGAPVPLI